jgi:hypothetical protein
MSVFITYRCLVSFLLVPLISVQSFAKGGGAFGRSEDRYNPDHIESLPPEIREAVITNVVQREPCIPLPATLTTYKRSSCTLSIFPAIQADRFAARPDACIRSTLTRMATSGSYEATMLRPGIEFPAM